MDLPLKKVCLWGRAPAPPIWVSLDRKRSRWCPKKLFTESKTGQKTKKCCGKVWRPWLASKKWVFFQVRDIRHCCWHSHVHEGDDLCGCPIVSSASSSPPSPPPSGRPHPQTTSPDGSQRSHLCPRKVASFEGRPFVSYESLKNLISWDSCPFLNNCIVFVSSPSHWNKYRILRNCSSIQTCFGS